MMQETAETLAIELSNCADSLSSRLSVEIKTGKVTQEQANQIINKIAILRQQANALYMETVIDAVSNQLDAQKKLEGTISQANEKIKNIENVVKVFDLAADVIEFAANAYKGDVLGILQSINKLDADVKSF